jgi:hypothetical protein
MPVMIRALGNHLLSTFSPSPLADELCLSGLRDLIGEYSEIVESIPNDQLRAQINNYFSKEIGLILQKKEQLLREKLARRRKSSKPIILPPIEPTQKELARVKWMAVQKFPEIVDYYLWLKEKNGDKAVEQSQANVEEVRIVEQLNKLLNSLDKFVTGGRFFTSTDSRSLVKRDVHILFRLTWFASSFDVQTEANSGRGPVDFSISKGSANKSLVEFKLASNSQLASNLEHQTEIYKKAQKPNQLQ